MKFTCDVRRSPWYEVQFQSALPARRDKSLQYLEVPSTQRSLLTPAGCQMAWPTRFVWNSANFISGEAGRRTPKFDGEIMQLHEACNFHCHVWLTCEGSLSRYGKFQHNLGKWRIFAGCMENIVSKIFEDVYRQSIHGGKFVETFFVITFFPQHHRARWRSVTAFLENYFFLVCFHGKSKFNSILLILF